MQPCRVVTVGLPWRLEPHLAALLVAADACPFALIGEWAGGGALIGSEPVRIADPSEDPFGLLDEQPAILLDERPPVVSGEQPLVPLGGEPGLEWHSPRAVGGGWFGYLGYRLGQRLETVGACPPHAHALPDFHLAFYDHLLRLDGGGRWWFEALWSSERDQALRKRLGLLRARAAGGTPRPRPFTTAPWRATPRAAGHARAVAACSDRIRAGDLFQANLSLRLSSRCSGDPADLFAAAVQRLEPGRAALLGGPWGAIVSLSPELFLERHARRVRSAPIKGTRACPDAAMGAAAELRALLDSEKDQAEHTMIVDLMRNDLGRVCEPGSIEVPVYLEPRAQTGVWHLVSEVAGTLAEGVCDADLVRAAFPPGSVTGAPKVAAMNVIAELESTARDVYTGAIGFAGPVAGLELSVAIRTFELVGDEIRLGVGGGIVADSDPRAETGECLTKAAPLLAAIGGRLERYTPSDPPAHGPRRLASVALTPPRLGPRPIPRPDPREGVFETMMVLAGRPVALEEHLARLSASVRSLYGVALSPDVRALIVDAAGRAPARARLRVTFKPELGGAGVVLHTTPLRSPGGPVSLSPVTIPGGLGAHKWADRRLLDALARALAPALPLICDLDAGVLEAARASVFMLEAPGTLLTPPLDARILPGVTRARVIEMARRAGLEVREESFDLERLSGALEVFVTGALGGVETVRDVDRKSLPTPGTPAAASIANRLAADLWADSLGLTRRGSEPLGSDPRSRVDVSRPAGGPAPKPRAVPGVRGL